MKRYLRKGKTRAKRQRRQRKRTQRRRRNRNGGASPPDENVVSLQRLFYPMSLSILASINGATGRWVTDFSISETNTYKIVISADSNNANQSCMSNFIQNLQSKIQEINDDLTSRSMPVFVNDLQVSDISKEEATDMTQNSQIALNASSVEEIFEDWDTSIHKLIIVSARSNY